MKSKKWFILLGFTLIALLSFMAVLHANEDAKMKKAEDIVRWTPLSRHEMRIF